jgi:acyl-coenzyme A thioesterase PaaI-like protein
MKATNFPELKSMQRKLWLLGFFKIPMIGFCKPKLEQLDPVHTVLRIPFRRRTKHHLNSLYFGALMIGAELTAGLSAYAHSEQRKGKMSLAFKSCKAEFLKRAESDVRFVCKSGKQIEELVDNAIRSGERHNLLVPVQAFDTQNDLVAEFELEVSVKISGHTKK